MPIKVKPTSSYGKKNIGGDKKKRKKSCNNFKGIERVKCILSQKGRVKSSVGPNVL
tara:strand:+ start:2044 stop:2211 length:168 start_codon:yes stop_codon:yes gene_type:complete